MTTTFSQVSRHFPTAVTISELGRRIGYTVEVSEPMFDSGQRVLFEAEEMDGHYVLLNHEGKPEGVTDLNDEGRKEALSRLHALAKTYAHKIEYRNPWETVEISDRTQAA